VTAYVEPVGALTQGDIAAPQRVEAPASLAVADAGAQALAAYQEALARYDAVSQRDMSGFSGLQAAFMQIQGYQVVLAYQRCLEYGIDPARQAYSPIQKERRA
jgi:hypothetical protein